MLKIYSIQLFRIIAAILLFASIASAGTTTITETQVPVPGVVTMVDLGAKKCIPCKMMAPILEELEKEYKDRAAIVFIDVWVNPDAGKKFGIRAIPTQIFYDAEGNEVLRHEGFFDKAGIVAELQKLGVQ
ncbi:thioredoxin family protein [Desulforhopalus sp. IMCC35007]|uniref:thioredoxin family protein n=1 Tax=Desulforhopalus sp. IMCC35007 TaxID=2569543 RepID=UPI003529EEC5